MVDDAELAARRVRLKMALEDLREMRGFGTELVTLIGEYPKKDRFALTVGRKLILLICLFITVISV